MTGYSLVKCCGTDTDPERAYTRTGQHEPKQSFHAAARRYADAETRN
jgi:hypothetical protein